MTWQPIETAPRDGIAIWLTWMENSEAMESYVMSWQNGMWQSPTGFLFWIPDKDVGPTHWRQYRAD
jgi:hypothetical protein